MRHIGFSREPDIDLQRRTQANPTGFPRAISGSSHGARVIREFDQSTQAVAEARREAGVDPSRLMVLEVSSSGNEPRKIIERLGASVVDERPDSRPTIEILAKLPEGVKNTQARERFADVDAPAWRIRPATNQDLPQELRSGGNDESNPAKNYVVFQLPEPDQASVPLLQTVGFEPIGDPKETSRDVTRMLVQFPSQELIDSFLAEGNYYRQGSEAGQLPRGMRRDFFDTIEWVGCLAPTDRQGPRLRLEGYPDGIFALDVDLWHPGNPNDAREVLQQLRQLCRGHEQVQLDDHLITNNLLLARIHCHSEFAQRLTKWDVIAQIDLPPRLPPAYHEIFSSLKVTELSLPDGTEPTICVVDSGVLAGHSLLQGWIIDEYDFETGEDTVVDRVGHGTQVAGLAVYGDVARCLELGRWVPRATVLSAKVLRADPNFQTNPAFPEYQRPEKVVKQAIEHFHNTHGCRVFNLSLGNSDELYQGGRQFAWAEVLDQLARERSLIIVVAAGNSSSPPWPDAAKTREQFQSQLRDLILADPNCRVCNPATAAIAVTVGAIARSETPRPNAGMFAGAPQGAPAPFSRVGPGYGPKDTQSAIKPDFVAYGGNYGVQSLGGAPDGTKWISNWVNRPSGSTWMAAETLPLPTERRSPRPTSVLPPLLP